MDGPAPCGSRSLADDCRASARRELPLALRPIPQSSLARPDDGSPTVTSAPVPPSSIFRLSHPAPFRRHGSILTCACQPDPAVSPGPWSRRPVRRVPASGKSHPGHATRGKSGGGSLRRGLADEQYAFGGSRTQVFVSLGGSRSGSTQSCHPRRSRRGGRAADGPDGCRPRCAGASLP